MRANAMRFVRDAAYRLIVATRYPAYRRRHAGAAIFAFHNVAPDEGVPARSDRSLHITSSDFQDYLAVIADGCTVVPLAEISDRVRQRRPVDGLAALTFDDAYCGALTHGVRTIARRGLPSSVFVVSDAAAAPSPFWWDLLGADGAVPSAVRNRAMNELHGDRCAVLEQYPPGNTAVPSALMPATWREVRDAAARDGCMVGSHTVSHRNLAALDAAALREELERSRAEIGAAMGAPPNEVSYPYGLHNSAVIEAAREAGYRTGVTMRFALATRDDDPLALPRINVPAGISVPALECWAAGIRLRGAS